MERSFNCGNDTGMDNAYQQKLPPLTPPFKGWKLYPTFYKGKLGGIEYLKDKRSSPIPFYSSRNDKESVDLFITWHEHCQFIV